jgi:hypothetical protein
MDQYEDEDSEWMRGLELINSNEEDDLNNEKSVGDISIPEKVLDDIIQSNSFDQYCCSPPPLQSNPMYPVQYYENQNYSLNERNSFITESYVPTSHGLLKITYPVSLVPPSVPNVSGNEQTNHYHQQQIPAHNEIVDLVQRHFTQQQQQQQSSLQTSSSYSSSSSSSFWPQPTDYHLLHSSATSHYSSANNNNNNQIHQCHPASSLSMNPVRSSSSSSLTFQSTTSQPSSPYRDIFQVTSQLDFATFLSMDSSDDDDSDDNDEEVDREETENLLNLFEDFPSSSTPAEDNNQAKTDHSEEQTKKRRDRKKKSDLLSQDFSSSCSLSRKRRKIHHNNGDEDEDEYLPTDNDEEELEEEIADDQSNFRSQEPKPPPHSVKRKKSAMAMTVGSPKARKKASQFARDILMDWLVKHEGEH